MRFKVLNSIFLILIITLLLVSGQQGCQKKETVTFDTAALSMNFVTDAPPSQLVTGKGYPIYVDIANNGGYDIPQGNAKFFLSGIGDNLQGVTLNVANANFLNKKTEIQTGGKERLTFATQATPPERNLPSAFNFTVRLNSCYRYATIVQTGICVGKGDGICSLGGEKIATKMNSAAPIQVTSLTESIQGNKLYVTFKIENKGSGEVYLPSTDCTKLEQQDINEKLKKDQVEITVQTEEGFACTLQGGVKSLTGITTIGQVTCEKTLADEVSHSTPIEIALVYIYRESISKTLTILPA